MSLVAVADGEWEEAPKSYLGQMARQVDGFAKESGLVIEDSWFTMTSPSPKTARLEGKVPRSFFAAAR